MHMFKKLLIVVTILYKITKNKNKQNLLLINILHFYLNSLICYLKFLCIIIYFEVVFLQNLLAENERVRSMVPSALTFLCSHHVSKVEDVFDVGLTTLNWTSINVISYVERCHKALGLFFDTTLIW